jgi:hypothetical protein
MILEQNLAITLQTTYNKITFKELNMFDTWSAAGIQQVFIFPLIVRSCNP